MAVDQFDIGKVKDHKFTMELIDNRPLHCKPSRYIGDKRKFVREWCEK